MNKIKISIIGGGNVAVHLAREFAKHSNLHLQQMYNRHISDLKEFESTTEIIDDLSKLQEADIILIAISDDAIKPLSEKLQNLNALTVHTAGSVDINVLQVKRKGVFYPFQTFSKQKLEMDFSTIPILIEAQQKTDLDLLKKLAKTITRKVISADSRQRLALHISGVFAANFVNHLYRQAEQILADNNLSFDLIKPLILEVAKKIQTLQPQNAQTGPAVRGDDKIIKKHLNFLSDKNQKEIYRLLSKLINPDLDI
jgi:predicted short-subunit dehydrogenase-like oxidoreductase (DUF2520 family)